MISGLNHVHIISSYIELRKPLPKDISITLDDCFRNNKSLYLSFEYTINDINNRFVVNGIATKIVFADQLAGFFLSGPGNSEFMLIKDEQGWFVDVYIPDTGER